MLVWRSRLGGPRSERRASWLYQSRVMGRCQKLRHINKICEIKDRASFISHELKGRWDGIEAGN